MSEASESGADRAAGGAVPAYLVSGPVAWAERTLTTLAGVILLSTVLITTIDVAGRYLFNRPLGFAFESTELLMATVYFVSLSSATLRREHITIGLFEDVWRGRMAILRQFVISAIIFASIAFLGYRLYLFSERFGRYGDITNVLKFPLQPVAFVGAVGVGLAALAALVLSLHAAYRLVRSFR
jgi:TRAP-type C4-dicarboxylate transport system permease small subunit